MKSTVTLPTSLTTKLGTAKGVERSRIWIEGDRLVAAGFGVGTKFVAQWKRNELTLTVGPWTGVLASELKSEANADLEVRRVSGKRDSHPIIDIVGKRVHDTFALNDRTHVEVIFSQFKITIRRSPR